MPEQEQQQKPTRRGPRVRPGVRFRRLRRVRNLHGGRTCDGSVSYGISHLDSAWNIAKRCVLSMLASRPHKVELSTMSPTFRDRRAAIRSYVTFQLAEASCTERHMTEVAGALHGTGSKVTTATSCGGISTSRSVVSSLKIIWLRHDAPTTRHLACAAIVL